MAHPSGGALAEVWVAADAAHLTVEVTNDRGRVLRVLHRYYSRRPLKQHERSLVLASPFVPVWLLTAHIGLVMLRAGAATHGAHSASDQAARSMVM